MGNKSRSKRKAFDNVIIQTPEQFQKIVSSGVPEIVSDKCPPSISERLEQNPLSHEGAIVDLLRIGDYFKIMLQGNQIGQLNRKNAETAKNCASMGIHYSGKIYFRKGEFYAIFVRTEK